MPAAPTAAPAAAPARRFGALSGVFTPSLLTMLGVVLYLRTGWMVGQAGVGGALLVVAIAHAIAIATGLSISSIATNRTVGAGGAYYLISRSLGAPAGAAIGIPLYLGQTLKVAFFVIGFGESVAHLVPGLSLRAAGVATLIVLAALALKSTALALRAQYLVLGAIGLSLASLLAGGSADASAGVPWRNPDGRPLPEVFAVFFPAVIGMLAGVSMSGDLRDPRRDLPLGALGSVLAGLLVYTGVVLWLAHHAGPERLREDPFVFWTLSRVPALVYAGLWGAALSSALAALMGAPRTLQALAADRLAPGPFARLHGPAGEPRAGVAATAALALAGVLAGSLDAVATMLTMFYLAAYGFLNLACGLERWAASPSFRPDFRVPAWVSFAGASGCFYAMSIIDLPAMLAAVAVCGGIYLLAQRRLLGSAWGDARHGIWAALARAALHRLRRAEYHPRNWRPNLIVFGGPPDKRAHLVEIAGALVGERGIFSYHHLIEGGVREQAARRRDLLASIEERVCLRHPEAFVRVEVVDRVYGGVPVVAQAHGVGPLGANTAMLGWLRKPDRRRDYLRMLRDLAALDLSLLLVHEPADRGPGGSMRVQVWWGGLRGNGGLMLLCAWLLSAHPRWRGASVEVITVVGSPADRERAAERLARILADARLPAIPRVLVREGRALEDLMRAESRGADLALLGLRLPARDDAVDRFFARTGALLSALPTTVLVHGAHTLRAEPVLFDAAAAGALPAAEAPPAPPADTSAGGPPDPAAGGS